MDVRPLSADLGAELVDFDLKRARTPEESQELRDLFCQFHLLVVHGQDVDDDDQTRFMENFGPIHVVATGAIETYVSNRPDRPRGTGTKAMLWHQDGTYGERPGIATSLWAQEVSEDSSPTALINAVHVLTTLPPALRARIEPLHAFHMKDSKTEPEEWTERDLPEDAEPGRYVHFVHPLIYTMPHSGQEVLLVNEMMTRRIVELSDAESDALLEELFSYLYRDENIYSHQWHNDDIIIWDNFALQHRRSLDMGSGPRHLRRQSLDGWYQRDGSLLDWRETVVAYAGAPSDPSQ
jgi:taurine dioxygenase